MIGLTISDYLWTNHLEITRWFDSFLSHVQGERYLEIGPGYGNYFVTAIEKDNFQEYLAVDVSLTSVQGTTKFSKFFGGGSSKWKVLCQDFFEFSTQKGFDCIVMGEVLEHVEKPERMLRQIRRLLNQDGSVFLSTVINAPAIDHIYLFSTVEQVIGMVEDCGLHVEDYICTTENEKPLEKALKKRMAVTIAMGLKKGK